MVPDEEAGKEVAKVMRTLLVQAKDTLVTSMEAMFVQLVKQTVDTETMKFPCVFAKYCTGYIPKEDGDVSEEDLERQTEPWPHPLIDGHMHGSGPQQHFKVAEFGAEYFVEER